MVQTSRYTALGFGLIAALSAVTAPIAASASEEGKRNTALGLGAAAAFLLLTQKNKLPGAIVGAGALVAAGNLGRDRHHYREGEWRDHDAYRYRVEDYGRYDRDRYDHDRYDRDRYSYGRNDRDRYSNSSFGRDRKEGNRDRDRGENGGYRVHEGDRH